MPSNSVPFVSYGVLQIAFIFILFLNFLLTISYLLSANDESTVHAGNHTQNKGDQSKLSRFTTCDLVVPLIIASSIMLLTSCAVFYILIFRARTDDLVGNLLIKKRTASFKVALLSWILTSIETILRLIGLFHYQSSALDKPHAPWWAIVLYHVLLLCQTTFQILCLRVYEKNTRLRREGPGWMVTRKSFLIIMAFMNCYMWLLNVSTIKVLVDLTSHNMEKLLSGSVERIIYTVNRASTLAYHVESVQLFYKFYEEDSDSLLQQPYEDLGNQNLGANAIVETESAKGMWGGFFMFVLFVAMAGGSFLVRTDVTDIHYFATAATVGILLTIFCITLNTTLSKDNEIYEAHEIQANQQHLVNEDIQHHSTKMFKDISCYMAGEKVGHIRILLFYSICAMSYHFLFTMKIIFAGIEVDVYQPVREGSKGFACMSLTVFMFWMSHEYRKLRCWRDLNVMFWNVLAMVFLELIEETFEHAHKDPLQLYALPLAIDFKIYVLIHTYSDTVAARNEYRQELRRDSLNPVVSPVSSRSTTPSVD